MEKFFTALEQLGVSYTPTQEKRDSLLWDGTIAHNDSETNVWIRWCEEFEEPVYCSFGFQSYCHALFIRKNFDQAFPI
ncbi:hypothetical protein GT360_05760 [Vibrio astriarenae]|uniref:Uncharacterized protein n=1 Tax=Vibrio astriarenae TaxID=1481923 RepID=A0A7Z2YDD8_9VIBR|nr:hypothetical protein [Vibrio astriarenae]QIA63049.1 hypothetical protein GT360_05760 [Vibrio astriarenae]